MTAGSLTRAVIFGRARGVWEELAAAQDLGAYDHTLGVGKAVCDYPGELGHWVSFHLDLLPVWRDRRRNKGFPDVAQYWSSSYSKRQRRRRSSPDFPVDFVVCDGGSSGLVAVVVALERLEVDRVVLAGMPLLASAGHYDEEIDWKAADRYRKAWLPRIDNLRGRVRSMSGWTREQLGEPTVEWLRGDDDPVSFPHSGGPFAGEAVE